MATFCEKPQNELKTCPYNGCHKVAANRMPYHLIKCSRMQGNPVRVECPYNALHRIDPAEYNDHLASCPDSRPVVCQLEKGTAFPQKASPFSTSSFPRLPPSSTATRPAGADYWDDDDEGDEYDDWEDDVHIYSAPKSVVNSVLNKGTINISEPVVQVMDSSEALPSFSKISHPVIDLIDDDFVPMDVKPVDSSTLEAPAKGRFRGRGRGLFKQVPVTTSVTVPVTVQGPVQAQLTTSSSITSIPNSGVEVEAPQWVGAGRGRGRGIGRGFLQPSRPAQSNYNTDFPPL